MATQRKKFLDELKVEMGMRMRVWHGKRIERENVVTFASLEHERRYLELALLRRMVENMTDAEVNRFCERAKLAEIKEIATDLFT